MTENPTPKPGEIAAIERDEARAAIERAETLADAADARVNSGWIYVTELRAALRGEQ